MPTGEQIRTYPAGVPSWVDTEQPDLEAAQRFYGELFGWTFETATPPGVPVPYVIARLGGRDVAGLSTGAAEDVAWNTYIAVDDADAAATRVTAAGGELLSPPEDAGEGGRSAVCRDPAGAQFRLWQARRRPGAQAVNEPGSWNFSDIHTDDVAAVTAFYTEVFGWSLDDLGFGTLVRSPGYGDHLEATVDPGIRARQQGVSAPPGFEDAIGWLAPNEPGTAAHWHVSFTVADRDATATSAERLGATIVSTADAGWTRTALVRDPQGAVFTASQFTPPG
jgi:predicted enzyme related to lactoylglutathione lyase